MYEIVVPLSSDSPTTLTSPCGAPRTNLLAVDLAVAAHLGDEPLREGIDHRDADAV